MNRRRDALEALRPSQKIKALGLLTGGIAHDFDDLLQPMTGCLDPVQIGVESCETSEEHSLGAQRAVDQNGNLAAMSCAHRLREPNRCASCAPSSRRRLA